MTVTKNIKQKILIQCIKALLSTNTADTMHARLPVLSHKCLSFMHQQPITNLQMHWVESISQWASVVAGYCGTADAPWWHHWCWFWWQWCGILLTSGGNWTRGTSRHNATLYSDWSTLRRTGRSISTANWICRNRCSSLWSCRTWRIHWSNTRQGTLGERQNTGWWWCLALKVCSGTCNTRNWKISGRQLKITEVKQ